jgi:hypothetical protein
VCIVFASLIVASLSILATDAKPQLDWHNFQIGQVGYLPETAVDYVRLPSATPGVVSNAVEAINVSAKYTVFRILGPDTMLIKPETVYEKTFCVRGISTKGKADNQDVKLPQRFKVSQTTTLGNRTYFVLQAESESERQARELAEKQLSERRERERAEQNRKESDARARVRWEVEEKAAVEKKKKNELGAAAALNLIKQLPAGNKRERQAVAFRLEEFLKRYGDTKAAAEAKKMLEQMK